jgi:threonine synthase
MDIQVASNFERYLYYVLDEDSEAIDKLMKAFKSEGEISISPESLAKVQSEFKAHGVFGKECLNTISDYQAKYGYLLDPHSACGVAAVDKHAADGGITISLATAHPAKFNEAIVLCGIQQNYPPEIEALFEKPQRQKLVDGKLEDVAKELVQFYNA